MKKILEPFDDILCDFFDYLSKQILKKKQNLRIQTF